MNIRLIKPVSNDVPAHLDRKERIASRELIAFKDGKFKSLLTARWSMSKSSDASVIYCALWAGDNEIGHGNGVGKAGGGGYCKQSAAYEYALNQAGFYPTDPISGRGMSVVEESMEALAHHLGFEHFYISRG